MFYKIVVFGVKKSTISLMETFKDDIDLIVTVSDNIKKNTGVGGKPVMIINPKKSINIFLISGIGVIFIFSVLLYIFI